MWLSLRRAWRTVLLDSTVAALDQHHANQSIGRSRLGSPQHPATRECCAFTSRWRWPFLDQQHRGPRHTTRATGGFFRGGSLSGCCSAATMPCNHGCSRVCGSRGLRRLPRLPRLPTTKLASTVLSSLLRSPCRRTPLPLESSIGIRMTVMYKAILTGIRELIKLPAVRIGYAGWHRWSIPATGEAALWCRRASGSLPV